jgi:hypothetical protein
MGNDAIGIEIRVGTDKGGAMQPSPKKPRTHQGEKAANASLQIEIYSSKGGGDNVHELNLKEKGVGPDLKVVAASIMLKVGLSSGAELKEVDDRNFRHVLAKRDAKDDSLSTRDDRVQGLSGNHLTSSEDDLLFEEGQASQADSQKGKMGHKPKSEKHKHSEKDIKSLVMGLEECIPKMGDAYQKIQGHETEDGSMDHSEFDQASDGAVINITEAQKIPDTRHNSRILTHMEKLKDKEKVSKKRTLEGTLLKLLRGWE